MFPTEDIFEQRITSWNPARPINFYTNGTLPCQKTVISSKPDASKMMHCTERISCRNSEFEHFTWGQGNLRRLLTVGHICTDCLLLFPMIFDRWGTLKSDQWNGYLPFHLCRIYIGRTMNVTLDHFTSDVIIHRRVSRVGAAMAPIDFRG